MKIPRTFLGAGKNCSKKKSKKTIHAKEKTCFWDLQGVKKGVKKYKHIYIYLFENLSLDFFLWNSFFNFRKAFNRLCEGLQGHDFPAICLLPGSMLHSLLPLSTTYSHHSWPRTLKTSDGAPGLQGRQGSEDLLQATETRRHHGTRPWTLSLVPNKKLNKNPELPKAHLFKKDKFPNIFFKQKNQINFFI